ncbi:MAG: hypothetical protein RI897_2577 [Verrucomicrobiota bacterium]
MGFDVDAVALGDVAPAWSGEFDDLLDEAV